MNTLFFVFGILLILVTVIDIIWTTLWVDGSGGPISKRLSLVIWRSMKNMTGNNSKMLSLAGPVILTTTLLVWIVLTWVGWTFVFSSNSNSIINTTTNAPVTWYDRLYFVGYTIFTLGNGGFSPQQGMWQLLTTVMTGMGMLFLTLAASYIISILSAVVGKRAFASSVMGIGSRSTELIEKIWAGKNFQGMNLLLQDFSSQLSSSTQQHNAYPLLHYYHSEKPKQVTALSVALLDEMLSVMKYGLVDTEGLNPAYWHVMRSAIDDYLETLPDAYIKPSGKVPPLPDLNELRKAGLQVVSEEEFKEKMTHLEERRKQLLGIVTSEGQEWPNKD